MKLPNIQIILCIIAATLLSPACTTVEKSGKHLFILSGQSNMTGGLKKGFEQAMQKHFGKENVTIVISMRSGRGLRFWVKDYQYAGLKLSTKRNASNGEEYPRLLKAAKDGLQQAKFDSVSFIWMQGESDAGRKELCSVYAVNFNKLYNKLKTDLKLEKLHFVMGRISHYGLMKTTKNYTLERATQWEDVRRAQVKVAEAHSHGAWIDTDDLIDQTNLHYLGNKPIILGERFAAKAIKLIDEK
jgi:hypothetical protein